MVGINQIFKRSFTCPLIFKLRIYFVYIVPFHRIYIQHSLNKQLKPLEVDELPESPYYFEDGLRKVYPFYYHHETYCKGRWINRKLFDVYYEEFALYPKEEIEDRISKGIIKVNNNVVSKDYILKNADLLSAFVHKHELPVLGCPIKILFENDDFLVVDKPPSIPVHPCGLYRYNSVIHILANEYNIHNLFIIYRLDRLTSGVLVFTKSSSKSRELHNEMTLHSINKEYICRVEGNFPDGTIVCDKPIKTFYHKVGVNIVHHDGKACKTEFKKLSYNGKSSIVLCKPYTGRTHQIRVHLQFLGYPIVNDPVYNSFAFGPEKGKNGVIDKSIAQLLDELFVEHSAEWGLGNPHDKQTIENEHHNLKTSIFKKHYSMINDSMKYKKDFSRVVYDKNCYFCKTSNQGPEQNRLGIFLHAYKYQGLGWEFKSDMPFWALKDWNIA